MSRFCATIEYDGTAFHGFQRQREGQRTVQGEIERALSQIGGRSVAVLGAGRTDGGVHATGQVIAFDMAWPHGEEKLRLAVNSQLAGDVAVLQLRGCADAFHPRYDAKRRAYVYLVEECPDRVFRPLNRWRHWQIRSCLDVAKMNEAAGFLVGEHDFGTFGRPPHGNNSVRQVFVAEWHRKEVGVLAFEVAANAFLYRMVRSLVGSLKLVGDGSWTVAEFVTAFDACERQLSGASAPAHGLYLTSVMY